MADGVLTVVQLNAGSLLEPGWDKRRHEVVSWLRHLDADVVCLEEIWQDSTNENTAKWIVDQVPELTPHWTFGGAPFGERLWADSTLLFGSAVLSRWPSRLISPGARNPAATLTGWPSAGACHSTPSR